MSFKTEIEKLIESNLRTYRNSSDRFLADYYRELELTKEYNGRQLLELLQNADDAASEEVLISWDKEDSKLTISNKGEPFEVGGIKSLMLANLSTKTKINYIGNKGLGFRSILNWSEQINIVTNGCHICFSEAIAKDVFDNQLKLTEEDKLRIRADRNLTQQAIPFPVLGIPTIQEETKDSEWTTSIEISYRKEFEEDIEKQLSEIREEILLFLNNIQNISIQNGKTNVEISSTKETNEDCDILNIQKNKWRVFTLENELPAEYQDRTKNEKSHYSLKVAFKDDLSDTYYKLFNFFPTQLSISLPCIIHGTFELNSSRNHLNESKKNEYILEKLIELLKRCAVYLTQQGVDWRAYKLLTPTFEKSDSRLITVFYEKLSQAKLTEKIYPCINNEYIPFEDIVYYSDNFNAFFQKHFSSTFTELLIPLNNEVDNAFEDEKYDHKYLVEKVDELSANELSVEIRGELIAQLAEIIDFKQNLEKFSLLINDNNEVINKNVVTFTPVRRSQEEFKIPKVVSLYVDFMNNHLYELLYERFKDQFDKSEKDKKRELQRIIKSVVNLQPYDSNNVIDRIITVTKENLESLHTIEEKKACIKEMVAALYFNFNQIENRQEKLKVRVPLITAAEQISNADILFLNNTYPSGKLTEIIYEGIFSAADYLINVEFWGLKDEYPDTVEMFFLWLGVNKYSKISTVSLRNCWQVEQYIDFIFANGTPKPDHFEISKIERDSIIYEINRFEEIQKLPVNKLILLVLKDSFIREQLEGNGEKISWYYFTWKPPIYPQYSYLRFQFLSSDVFAKYILEDRGEELNKLINDDFQIDYEYLGRYGINKTEAKAILLKLGAKESFIEIAPESIYELIKSLPLKDPKQKGNSTQSIYKMALDALVKQDPDISAPDDLVFFAKKGEKEEYQPAGNIYYSDNTVLPKNILDTLYMLNLPKRIGEDNVERFFGVKSLKGFKIGINKDSIQLNRFNPEFIKYFESIKPYLLAYRLEKISDLETKRREAKTIKQCQIQIVNECQFSFGAKVNVPIEQKEYINIKDEFFYKDENIISIDALKRDSIFCDAFAEMMCIAFKVNDLKNYFRHILRNDLTDTRHLAIQDLGLEKTDEAFQLLGISRIEIDFWKRVFELKGKELQEPIKNTEVLKNQICKCLGFILPDNYTNVNFDSFSTTESFELIKKISDELSISVQQIAPVGISFYHKNRFFEEVKNHEHKFKNALWSKLSALKTGQATFIQTLNRYNQCLNKVIQDEIELLKFKLTVPYNNYISKWINEKFEIDINSSGSEKNTIENGYDELLQKYSIEVNDIEDESIRSLLYFDGNRDQIEQYLKQYYQQEQNEEANNENSGNTEIGKIFDASLNKLSKLIMVRSSAGSNSIWIYSNKTDRAKKRKGKAAELLVYNTLKDKYGVENVNWVSGNSTTPEKNDNLHYDIEYKDNNNEWKYLEVKAIFDDYFILSNPEKEKGLSESEKYQLALVKENKIFIVKDIFKFNSSESFDNNSKFIAQTKDYYLTFKMTYFEDAL